MDPEREDLKVRYRLCKAGFSLNAIGLGLLCLNTAVVMAYMLTGEEDIRELLQNPLWDWLVGAPITWTTLIGSYLLWGRSKDPAWQRCAGLLVLMNFVDLMLWALEHGEALGLRLGDVGHEWFRYQLGRGLGWAEFLLFTRLATDMTGLLGKPEAPEVGRSASSLASIGLILWALGFITQTDWRHGWPLVHRRLGPRFMLMRLGGNLLLTITAYQVAALNIAAARECGRALAAMDQEDQSHELLRSRSEPFGDDHNFWNPHEDPWA
jgi:hypothetical protein